jgi:hypothetical protein
MRHPGIGSLGYAALLVADDAARGALGLTVPQAHEVIINRQRGWCIDQVGWTWLTVTNRTDEDVMALWEKHPDWNKSGAGWYVDFEIDAGRPTVWGPGRRAYRFNWAVYAQEHEFSKEDAYIKGCMGHRDNSLISVEPFEKVIKAGFLPGQKVLVRGEGWSNTDYWGEYDDGYNVDIVYASPIEYDDQELAKLLAKDQRII